MCYVLSKLIRSRVPGRFKDGLQAVVDRSGEGNGDKGQKLTAKVSFKPPSMYKDDLTSPVFPICYRSTKRATKSAIINVTTTSITTSAKLTFIRATSCSYSSL